MVMPLPPVSLAGNDTDNVSTDLFIYTASARAMSRMLLFFVESHKCCRLFLGKLTSAGEIKHSRFGRFRLNPVKLAQKRNRWQGRKIGSRTVFAEQKNDTEHSCPPPYDGAYVLCDYIFYS
jgi:hypothetical protein